MENFLKEHPILATVTGLIIFLLWTLPQWLATVWPAFSKKTLPEWLADRQGGVFSMTPLRYLIVTGLLTLVVVTVFVVTVNIVLKERKIPDYKKWQLGDVAEVISNHIYANETVEIDGKTFDHCEFTNVTLVYHGIANTTFLEVKFHGSLLLKTDNVAAKGFAHLTSMMKNLMKNNPNAEKFVIATIDADGKMTVLTEDKKESENPARPPQ